MSRILIVDDEASICWALRESMSDEGHHVEVAASAEEGLRIAESSPFDAIMLDVRLPGIDGLSAMPAFRERTGAAPIIVITAFGNLETAVGAIENGAFDYLVKPFDLDQATTIVKRALESQDTRAPHGNSARTLANGTLVGSSAAMQDLFKRIALVAPTDVPVLITGESGTGKELVARAIHHHSTRRDKPFLPVCVAALSPTLVEAELFGHVKGSFTGATQDRKGLFELAHGGTILLDEAGDIPLNLQVKLLRAIEHREINPVGDTRPRPTNIRVIAATNQPLAHLIETKQFREDLFFRLSVFQIEVPPLRDRANDIPPLANHFLDLCRAPEHAHQTITPQCLDALHARPWTGNVRELRNAIEHAAVVSRGQPLRPEHLPPVWLPPTPAPASATDTLRQHLSTWADAATQQPGEINLYEHFLALTEPPLLRAVLHHHQNNRANAAQTLGIHRATLRQKLRKYGIE